MDAACPELGSDCPATGHPVPGQVQDTVLKKHYYLEFFDRFDKLAVGVGGHGRLLRHNKTKLDTVQFTLPIWQTKAASPFQMAVCPYYQIQL